jgi:uncharacterized iron-regulated membrane protein
MTTWQLWVQRPQGLWVRKALFQVHLWVGLGIGIYVLLISISGSAIVYRRELLRKYAHKPVILVESSHRMSLEELKRSIHVSYPMYDVYRVYEPEPLDQPYEVVLGKATQRISRLFNPYTGADLGDAQFPISRAFQWMVDLHYNLLSGTTGRFVNGIGACFVTVLSLTGIILWWPGIKNWRRSITINRAARFARLNWDLHSAIGLWFSVLVFIWGISGVCLCFPGVLTPLVNGQFLFWITQLHFGRFNTATEALWMLLGLVPAILFSTGFLMWWNRVLRKKLTGGSTTHT